MTLQYHSTRGGAPILDFKGAVLAGLAADGGLYLPRKLPRFTPGELVAMQGLDYLSLFQAVLAPFGVPVQEGIYRNFSHQAIAPLKQLAANDWLLELFHGPTLAFKDFALQFLGPLLDGFLRENDETVTVLGATSGDTGSAAIAGCRGRKTMRVFILHPHNRVSAVQRRQMTTVHDHNVHNLAIQGSFDDCQNIVKALFTDQEFKARQKLTAVNSINWARILAQIVYYFYAALRLGAPAREVSFSVPTGNFGDIYAGWLAKAMGLPVRQLIIASNRNDILARCVATGEYRRENVTPSLSPSMDIQISSNFERLLFEFYDGDASAIRGLMQDLKTSGGFKLSETAYQRLRKYFSACCVDDQATLATIRRIHETTGEILDPHSAVGVAAAEKCRKEQDTTPIITLATAHPAKFPDAVRQAIGSEPPLPPQLAGIFDREEKFSVLPAEAGAVRKYIDSVH